MEFGQSVTISEITQKISCSRTYLMGLAMLMVVLFHCGIKPFSYFGYWGVDIFFFLSGFSICFSLSKNDKLPNFYLKRFLRIMPGAIICGIAFFCLDCVHGIKTLALCGLNLWYIRTILIFYILSPFLFVLFKRRGTKALLFLIIFAEIMAYFFSDHFYIGKMMTETLTWSFSRLPIFMLGMALPLFSSERMISVSVRRLFFASLVGILILGGLRIYQAHHHLGFIKLLFMPSSLLVPSILLMSLFYTKWMNHIPLFLSKILYIFGFCSLEIYLIHEAMLKYTSVVGVHIGNALLSMTICVIVSVFLAYILNVLCRKIQTFCLNLLK